ncbi:IPT/TIG domain-containing protein [Rathayibacter oskolensis]|uniref:IPT/TIG domain-containing protein n=1 Tax=Rathayibacter oskolensis TaxID=1891671 RepID=A0A1X7MZL8_9MICO|nr:amidase domain-containing protein [Rathayibacter oskolensis]SMH30403.1 IPT/TIG domain-containing protein [Rathayibacter oskolensis]
MPHRSTRSTPAPPLAPETAASETAAPEAAPLADGASTAPPLTRREAREREGRRRADPGATETVSVPVPVERAVSAPVPPHSVAETVFSSRRDRRTAEGHRQRAEPARRGASFFRPSRRHLVLAMSGGLVVVAVASGVSLTVGSSGSAESAAATSTGTPSTTPSPSTVAVLPATTASARVVLSAVSTTSGTVAGGTSVTLSGANLDAVATVRFGDAEGSVAVENPDQITVTAPPASGEAEGVVPVAFFDSDGRPITFDAVTDEAAAVTVDGTPAEAVQPAVDTAAPEATAPPVEADPVTAPPATAQATVEPASDLEAPAATASPSPTATGVLATTKVVASAITFAYTPDPAIEAAKAEAALAASRLASQLDYLETYWSDYNSAQYGAISGNDCVNFASQSLIARGWAMDGEWNYSSTGGYSSAWASSTAFNSYLAAHPERATPLSNAQRDQVEVGDVVQFDWDGSGDWDHTGIVTAVDGDTILYSSHTVDNFDQSIDSASAARIMFWSV